MSRSMLRFVVALALTVLVASLAHAEIIELEGTVRAVNSDDRSIAIERKTAKGTKTLELEVAKKAGNLGSVKVGDSITFGYDPDLEIVTKIGGGEAAEESAAEKRRCTVTFSISETGDCVLRVQRAAAAVRDSSRVKQKDGTWVCKHLFAKPSDMDVFQGAYGPVLNVRVDKKQQCLVFKADTVPEADKKLSQVTYPQKFRVPFEVALDLSVTGNKFLFQIQPLPTLLGQHQSLVNIKSGDAFANKVTVDVASMTRDAQGKPTFEPPLMKEETISLDEPWEKRFRLPVPNVRSRDAYVLRMGTLGESAVEVGWLMVRGVPLPSVGIKLGERNGVVFAESVVPQSLAEEAGVEVGDAINAIQGKPVSSVNEAVEWLSDLPFGETSEITIQRGDDKNTIRVKPTFDQDSKGSASPSPEASDVADDQDAVVGVYDIEWTEQGGKRGTLRYELNDDGTFLRAGKPAGKWELVEGVIQIRFDDASRGSAILRSRSPDGLEGTHTKGDGKKSTWTGKKVK